MFDWLFGRNLEGVLSATKKVRVRGIRFTIRKVNISHYMEGTSLMFQNWDTHKTEAAKEALASQIPSQEKIKKHYAAVLVAGVLSPKLVHTKEDSGPGKGIHVEDMFIDQEMVSGLYSEIIIHTYGKKKVKHAMSVARNL